MSIFLQNITRQVDNGSWGVADHMHLDDDSFAYALRGDDVIGVGVSSLGDSA
jgi:uncharacterized cupin superfamily protein